MLNWINDWTNISSDILCAFDGFIFDVTDKKVRNNEWAQVFAKKPYIAEIIKIKAPQQSKWVDDVLILSKKYKKINSEQLRIAELKILKNFEDYVTYYSNPQIYDDRPFMKWNDNELLDIVDFKDKAVVDIGSGTGRQVFIIAPYARVVYAVEPVSRLRKYIKEKAQKLAYKNIFTIDGLIEQVPLENEIADVAICGHVFGDYPKEELNELLRIVKPGGMVILIPGNIDKDNEIHKFLLDKGFKFGRFEQPNDGIKRKYWLIK